MSEISYPFRGGPELESYVSRLLDEAGVPNFIWAEPVLSILGIETAQFFTGWVVPDEAIDRAAQALDEAKLPPCTQGHEGCSIWWWRRAHPIPDYHWHTDLSYPPHGPAMTCGVYLYRKSRLFWTFPDPPLGRPAPDDPYYMLTSDPRIEPARPMSRGRQSDARYPVKMPLPGRYIEALFRLTLRDLGGMILCDHWGVEINYLLGWVVRNPGLNLKLDDIVEPFREWARLLAYGDRNDPGRSQKAFKFELELYAEMARNKQLPPVDDPRKNNHYFTVEELMRQYNVPFDPAWVTPAEQKIIRD